MQTIPTVQKAAHRNQATLEGGEIRGALLITGDPRLYRVQSKF